MFLAFSEMGHVFNFESYERERNHPMELHFFFQLARFLDEISRDDRILGRPERYRRGLANLITDMMSSGFGCFMMPPDVRSDFAGLCRRIVEMSLGACYLTRDDVIDSLNLLEVYLRVIEDGSTRSLRGIYI